MSELPSSLRLQKRWTRITPLCLFAIPTLYFLYSLFIVRPHDWDLDAFLYLGSRLDNGKLLYLSDFETKLPLLQYVFWLPYRLGGIGAWRIITFVISFLFAIISAHLIVHSLTEQSQDHTGSRVVTALSAAVFLTFLYSLPGSLSAQVEMFAASFMYLAVALWHAAVAQTRIGKLHILLSGFAAAIAVSIRPNYLFVAPGFVLFSIGHAIILDNTEKCRHVIKQVSLFAFAGSLTTALQFLPYFLIKGGVSALVSAMSALLFQFSWASFLSTFEYQFLPHQTVAFYSFLYLGTGIWTIIFYLLYRGKYSPTYTNRLFLPGVALCVASIFGLEYSLVKTHYYPHNSILFVPYISLVFTYICVFLANTRPQRNASVATLIICYLSVTGTQLWHLRSTILTARLSASINDRNIEPGLLAFLQRSAARGMSFYVPDNAVYHMLLKEGRIGDAHPYMLYLVLSGQRVGPIGNIFLYSNAVYHDPCLALRESDKDVIVVSDQEPGFHYLAAPVRQCLLPAGSGYKQMHYGRTDYQIFVRRSALDRLNGVMSLSSKIKVPSGLH